MSNDKDDILKVGDIAEFATYPNGSIQQVWHADRVVEIRITQEFEDKEGVLVPQVKWSDILDYQCLAIVVGDDSWARNEDVRPLTRIVEKRKVRRS